MLKAGATAGSIAWGTLTKADVGLSNVENTADNAKSVLSATKLTTPRTITLTGDATGSVAFDGSANVSITVAVEDDSHKHSAVNITVADSAGVLTSTNVEAALNELFTFASNGKSSIATAVTAKGVSASPADTFAQLATKIGQIPIGKKTASGTAQADNNATFLQR